MYTLYRYIYHTWYIWMFVYSWWFRNPVNSPVEVRLVVSPNIYRVLYTSTVPTYPWGGMTSYLGTPRTHGPKMQVSKMGFPDQLGWIQSLGSSQSICFAGGSSRIYMIYNNFPFITKPSWWLSFKPFEKYAQVKLGIISPIFGMNIKKIWVATTQRTWMCDCLMLGKGSWFF